MIRSALYERVSSEEQARHGLSINEQSRTLTEYAQANNMTISGEYVDAGISARKRYTNRPALCRLLDDIRAEKIDTVLFIKLDRWFRNIADYYEVQKILDAYGVTWIATEEDYETITASGRFKVNIMLSVAQDEADRTSERIKFVMQGKRERNEPVCGSVPIGYKIENKKMIIDKEKEPYVRKAFDIYLETGSPGKVIDAVPELCLDYQKLRRMVSCTAYKGEYSGIEVPPYLTMQEWGRLQDSRAHITRKAKNNRVYLFSGLMRCPVCGHRMGGCYCRQGEKYYLQYRCINNAMKAGCANNHRTTEIRIENYLLEHIESRVQITIEAQKKERPRSYKAKRDAIEKKLGRLSELYVDGLIALDDYKKQYNKLQDDLAAVPADDPEVDAGKLQERFFPQWQDMYRELPQEGKQAFWRAALDSITLNEDGTVKDFSLRLY